MGTGPFKFKSYKPGESIVLVRNDDYWGENAAWEEVEFRPIKSGPTRVAALLAGDVDMISGVPTTDIGVLKGNADITLSQGVSNRVIYLHLDQFREDSPFVKANGGGAIKNPLLDVRVRTAISKAINRDAIVDRVMEGVAIPAGQLLPEGFFGVSENLKPVEFDPEGAKALLAEAGVPDGFELTIHGPNDRYINDAKIAEAIGQMLTRVGIKTAVETMPRSVYFGRASSGRHSNPEIDAKIEEALRTVDDAKRQALLAEATEMAINNVAIIPTHYQVNTWASKKGIKYIPRTDEYTLAMGVVKE